MEQLFKGGPMDSETLTAIIQALVTIITTLSGVWAIFTKKTEEIKQSIGSRMDSLETEMKKNRARDASTRSGDYKL
jgi:hypothetical protein